MPRRIRPTLVVGKPFVTCVQFAPPLTVVNTPLLGAFTAELPIAATRCWGLPRSITTSEMRPLICCVHEAPASTDLYKPTDVPAYRTVAVVPPAVAESITMLENVAPPAGKSKNPAPNWVHVAPASVERSTP